MGNNKAMTGQELQEACSRALRELEAGNSSPSRAQAVASLTRASVATVKQRFRIMEAAGVAPSKDMTDWAR